MELRERAIYKTLYGNLPNISKWYKMCRNVKIKLTYLKVRLSFEAVLGDFPSELFLPQNEVQGRRVRSILTIVLGEPTSQNALSSQWGATNHHTNHISIKPDKLPIIQNLQNDHKTIFCRRKPDHTAARTCVNHVRRLQLFETSRNTFHSAILLVSSNSRHAQTIDCPREGRGIYC